MGYEVLLLAALIFIAAMLYSSVGHAGASGYLAAMAFMGVAPNVMKPTVFLLNILVAIVALIKYYRVGAFAWRLFLPLSLTSIPFAYLGGSINLPSHIYNPLVGIILIYSAGYSLFFASKSSQKVFTTHPPLIFILLVGAAIGFVSGLTGVGGGIFLSPILLMLGWASMSVISGVASAFIAVNSAAGLLGISNTFPELPSGFIYWAIAAMIGGYLGSEYGSKRLGDSGIQRVLAVVLLIAGLKMISNGLTF